MGSLGYLLREEMILNTSYTYSPCSPFPSHCHVSEYVSCYYVSLVLYGSSKMWMWPVYLDELSGVEEKRARRGSADVGLAKRVQAECPQRQRPRRGLLTFPREHLHFCACMCICVCVCALRFLPYLETGNAHWCRSREQSCSKIERVSIAIFPYNAGVDSNLMFLP